MRFAILINNNLTKCGLSSMNSTQKSHSSSFGHWLIRPANPYRRWWHALSASTLRRLLLIFVHVLQHFQSQQFKKCGSFKMIMLRITICHVRFTSAIMTRHLASLRKIKNQVPDKLSTTGRTLYSTFMTSGDGIELRFSAEQTVSVEKILGDWRARSCEVELQFVRVLDDDLKVIV